jgi:hypothetical protein
METLYGVLGMMAVIVVIAIALVRAPRRTHAWEKPGGAPLGPARAQRTLREGRWRLREQVIETIGQSRMVSHAKRVDGRDRLAVTFVGPNLEGAALVLDGSLVDPALERVLEDGAGEWKGEIEHQHVEVTAPLEKDEPDVAALRRWLEGQELERPIGEIVMISIPAIDYRVPFERPLLREYRDVVRAREAELGAVTRRNAEEAEWVERAREMKASAARAATATDDTLRDLEEYARAADELTDRKDDAQAVIDAGVKRRFLIVQLAAFSLLDPAERELGDSLERRGFARLASLHRAACKLADYLASDVRAEIVGVRAPEPAAVAVLSAPFSLDLFRRGTLVVPSDLAPNRALAQAEAELLWNPENGAGSMLFVKSAGFRYAYALRVEDGFRTVISGLTVSRV